uniref:Uncharacterized protein n=1 Tax=Acrobeloides nanus TaxID=290746 RepID=A0A914D6J6_9BILA
MAGMGLASPMAIDEMRSRSSSYNSYRGDDNNENNFAASSFQSVWTKLSSQDLTQEKVMSNYVQKFVNQPFRPKRWM